MKICKIMPQKIVIGITSKIAAGKGTVAKYLQKKYKAKDYRFSTMLRDILNRLYLEIDRKNMQKLSTLLRQNFGEDIMAKVMAEDVKNDNSKIIIVDGVRRLDDIKYLREIEGFKLVAIETDIKKRYKRLVKRNENHGDDKKTYAQFLKDEQGEAELQVPKTMAAADAVINNNGSLGQLYKRVAGLIEKI
jgi:dephospho-CoA kinase